MSLHRLLQREREADIPERGTGRFAEAAGRGDQPPGRGIRRRRGRRARSEEFDEGLSEAAGAGETRPVVREVCVRSLKNKIFFADVCVDGSTVKNAVRFQFGHADSRDGHPRFEHAGQELDDGGVLRVRGRIPQRVPVQYISQADRREGERRQGRGGPRSRAFLPLPDAAPEAEQIPSDGFDRAGPGLLRLSETLAAAVARLHIAGNCPLGEELHPEEATDTLPGHNDFYMLHLRSRISIQFYTTLVLLSQLGKGTPLTLTLHSVTFMPVDFRFRKCTSPS